MRRKLTLAFCAIIATCATLCLSCRAAPAARYSTTFPYTPFKNLYVPLAQVWVNGRPATFVVDTATSFTGVTAAFAAQLGLAPTPFFEDGRPYMVEGEQAQAVTASTLQIGNFAYSPSLLLVLRGKVGDNFSKLFGPHVDGILGSDSLGPFAALFDFPGHRITLWTRGGLTDEEVRAAGFGGASATALVSQDGGSRFAARVRFANKGRSGAEDLAVDTGAAITTVPLALATRLGLEATGPVTQFGGVSGHFPSGDARVESLQVGDLRLVNCPVVYPTHAGDLKIPSLGLDVLSGYRVLLDFPAGKMYVALPPLAVKVQAAPSEPPPGAAAAKGATNDAAKAASPTSATP